MKILVTGCAGFIGYFLTKRLLQRGDTVIGIDNLNDYYDVNLKYGRLNELGVQISTQDIFSKQESVKYSNFSFNKIDIFDTEAIDNIFKEEQFDAVCNLAAQAGVRYSIENPHVYIESNILGFLNILEGCRNHNVKNLCFASSSSVYGLNKSQPFKSSDTTDHPVSLYAATKKSNEMMAHSYAHLYGIQTTGVRFFTVYGPWGRPDMAPVLFTDAILNNRPIQVFNNGEMSRDFTYVEDIVDGLIKIINNPSSINPNWDANNPRPDSSSAAYKIYNIGNNKSVKLLDFIKTIELHLGKQAQKEMLPMQDGDVKSTFADVSGLVNDFNYKPSTDINEGVEKFIKWYKEFYNFKEEK
ncbi:NAD-dependent epimerase [Sulfurimonas sp.]|jgi:UDP-glucuronate 4-epimerase|uniref:NAD-dependent epimerase n=1 Tax=Sulfurimonas sp. TaxID=2022749 RepID=UPI0025DF0734|nr:NAD-dependent epimerase [Sulfurimonas sp.]MBT5935567.1 NAD-dependent epimerase [Sulfurimonas sp.]